MKSKLIKTIIACIIVAAVGVGGYYGYNKLFTTKTVKASTQYLTVNARKMNMQVTIQGTGAAYAAVTKDVLPNNNGNIKDLNVKVGDTVTAGQKLFTVDSDDLRKNVTSAQSNLNKQNLTLASDQASLANAQAAAAAATTTDNKNATGGQSNQSSQDSVASLQNKISMDQLNLTDAQNQLTYANQQLAKATVTAPIGGVITAVNNLNGDSVQPSKAVLSIVDITSLKVKVQVDELDIAKAKVGQKAQINFDAIKDKTFDGTVETIAQTGTTANNVTTYDVVVDITDPTGIKIGMNANVSIQVDSKDNVLTVPSEAIIDRNGQKMVMVPTSNTTTSSSGTNNSSNNNQSSQNNGQSANGNSQGQQSNNSQNGNSQNRNGQSRRNGQGAYSGSYNLSSGVRYVRVQTGLENENYVEITEGLNEGDKVLIQLPQTSSSTNSNNRSGMSGGFGGGFGGGGNFGGGNRQQSSGNSAARPD